MGLSVLHPGLLIAGLICISIPILVHLLRRKHRPISWGAMRFLEQAYRKRRRLITIEQLILLLTRCAIIALIAGAVGSLVLGSGLADQRARTMIIVLDNSIHSAAALDSGQQSIEYQRQRALDLLSTLDPTRGDRAALITIAAPALGEAVPATNELGLIRSRIEQVQSSDADRDLSGALSLVADVIDGRQDESIPQPVLILSEGGWDKDTQHNQHQLPGVDSILLDAPIHPAGSNIAIIDATPLRPMMTRTSDNTPSNTIGVSRDEIQGVRVTLQRSDASVAHSTRLIIENAQSDSQLATIDLAWIIGQEQLTQSIPLDPASLSQTRGGSAILRVSVADSASDTSSDTNSRDNTRLVGLPIRQHIGVGIIDSFTRDSDAGIRPSRWVRAVLGADDGLMSIQQINASSASDRIDPTLDILFILSPSALDARSWDRIARLNEGGMPMIITPDASSSTGGVPDWVTQLNAMAPGMIAGTPNLRSFDPPIGLASRLQTPSNLLQGIASEYPDLASSVTLARKLSIDPGPSALVLLQDSEDQPLVLVWARDSENSSINQSSGTLVLWGTAFDPDWTDLPARPLFVALTHELLRSLLASSIAPDTRVAGQSAASLEFGTLEPQIGTTSDPRLAGAFVQVDAQGTAQRGVIINPDASITAADQSILESPSSAIARSLPNIDIQELSSIADLSTNGLEQGSTPGRSIALMLFAIALALGVVELLLARHCSYKATGTHTIQARGAA